MLSNFRICILIIKHKTQLMALYCNSLHRLRFGLCTTISSLHQYYKEEIFCTMSTVESVCPGKESTERFYFSGVLNSAEFELDASLGEKKQKKNMVVCTSRRMQ